MVKTKRNASSDTIQAMDGPGERLRQLADLAGYESLAEFGRACGIEAGTTRQHAFRNSIPKDAAQVYVAHAKATGATVEWLLYGTGTPPRSASQPPAPREATFKAPAAPQETFLPARQSMPKDVPVFGTSMGGDETGDFEFNGQIVDYVRRPPRLDGRADVFAIYVQGASMSPWREPGELAYVERNRPPRSGDYVVVEFQADAHNVRPALIKKLAAITPTKIKLQQYNPPRVFEIDRMKKRHQLYRVIDWTELMGV